MEIIPGHIKNPNLVAKRFQNQNQMGLDVMDQMAADLRVTRGLLESIKIYPYTGILYPHKALFIYNIVRSAKAFIQGHEKECNDAITEFMTQRFLDIGKTQYLKLYQEAMTQTIFKLVALRGLVATFEFGENRFDYLPADRRPEMCKYLNLPDDISCDGAMTKLEEASKLVNDEEAILGRLGYLITWKLMAGPKYEPVVKKEDNSIRIVYRGPVDIYGLPLDRKELEDLGIEDVHKDIVQGPVPGVDIPAKESSGREYRATPKYEPQTTMAFKVISGGDIQWFDSVDEALAWIKKQIGMAKFGVPLLISMHKPGERD